MQRTCLGLEVRAITHNPSFAANMHIDGVAIGLFAKLTYELGTNHIVQSLMTVVVNRVGNIRGALVVGEHDMDSVKA